MNQKDEDFSQLMAEIQAGIKGINNTNKFLTKKRDDELHYAKTHSLNFGSLTLTPAQEAEVAEAIKQDLIHKKGSSIIARTILPKNYTFDVSILTGAFDPAVKNKQIQVSSLYTMTLRYDVLLGSIILATSAGTISGALGLSFGLVSAGAALSLSLGIPGAILLAFAIGGGIFWAVKGKPTDSAYNEANRVLGILKQDQNDLRTVQYRLQSDFDRTRALDEMRNEIRNEIRNESGNNQKPDAPVQTDRPDPPPYSYRSVFQANVQPDIQESPLPINPDPDVNNDDSKQSKLP